ncbi:MAG: phosphate/phosphite/phosphonate ABC transporter substrate-binding protein [Alphaproteobacteria bacterium]|nr:phosphate/phosphite/phosphonate ABC transporter substrate-binding protein [Alphaproteobacteria bacterium]
MLTRRHLIATAAASSFATAAMAQDTRELPKPGKRAWAAKVPVVRIGLLGGENDADRLQRVDGYKKLIEKTFDIPTKLLMASDYAGVIQAFAAGQVDLSYMSPASYAAAWIESKGNIVPLTTSQEKDGGISYVAVAYVRADSGITSIEQLKGKSLAWADPNSASGYLIPRSEFRGMGIDPESGKYFGRTGFGGGHEQAVVAVLNKQYDAGVTWASGLGEVSEGYTRGALRAMVEKKLLDMKDLRIIWKSRPIVNGPLAIRGDTPPEFQADMLALHRAIPRTSPDIFHSMDMGSSIDWVPVKHADYQVFVDMLQAEAAQRRKP